MSQQMLQCTEAEGTLTQDTAIRKVATSEGISNAPHTQGEPHFVMVWQLFIIPLEFEECVEAAGCSDLRYCRRRLHIVNGRKRCPSGPGWGPNDELPHMARDARVLAEHFEGRIALFDGFQNDLFVENG